MVPRVFFFFQNFYQPVLFLLVSFFNYASLSYSCYDLDRLTFLFYVFIVIKVYDFFFLSHILHLINLIMNRDYLRRITFRVHSMQLTTYLNFGGPYSH